MFKPKKIIVPTDFSEHEDQCSIGAVKQAVELARQFNAELEILHVITKEVERMPLFFLDDDKLEELQEKMADHAFHELETIRDKYASDPELKVKLKIREGIAYAEILNEQTEWGADLIVIGSHGHSRLQEFFYGSTTEKVARRAHCSVLVARKFVTD